MSCYQDINFIEDNQMEEVDIIQKRTNGVFWLFCVFFVMQK